ncbi:hypothetical protein pb186bvf_015214 [Paramecium bursaria]
MNSKRSVSTPLLKSSSSLSRQNSFENFLKFKRIGDNLVIKVFKLVAKIHNWSDWLNTYEKFKSYGYDDLNQVQLARVADLICQYQLEGKIAIQLYLELQKVHIKQSDPNQPFFPTNDEIQSISLDSLRNLHKMPAEIRFQSSKSNHLQLHLIVLFGPQNSGKTTFISSCINFIRRIEYYSLLRYIVQKDEKIIKIDDGQEQYCFIKVEAITNPYENRYLAINLSSTLKDAIKGRQVSSFSVLYFALSTQTRVGMAEKYQVRNGCFHWRLVTCSFDSGFIDNYILQSNLGDGNKQKYIFNNKLLCYEYRNRDSKSNPLNRNSQSQIRINENQPFLIRSQSQGLDQSQISNNQIQQQKFINQENDQSQVQNQVNEEQSSLNQSQIQDLSIDNVDMTFIYWMRNKDNFIQLKKDITEQQNINLSREELMKFMQCLKFLKKVELQIEDLIENKKNILKIEKLILENIENLQIIQTQIQYIYLDHKDNQIHYTPLVFATNVKILICKQCNSICHKACSAIESCSRLKNNFCKSCSQNRNQICNKNKHILKDQNELEQTQTTSVIQVKAYLQESKNQKIIKDKYIRNIRLYQLDMFKLKRKYNEEVQKVHQFINQYYVQPNQSGFLKINFENYKKLLDKVQLEDDGQLYRSVIDDLVTQNINLDPQSDQ